jgi:hypothetical protein
MCRVKASVREENRHSSEQLPPLDHIIHGHASWPGQSLYEMNVDTGEITLYLMREGVELPQENG